MKALIIDDSRTMRMILSKTMKTLGFEVAEAGNGREALDHLRREGKPDLALVDWNMPVMGGYEFVRAVRGDAQLSNLPLLMVTTETEMDQVAAALEAGVNEYIMKPFTADVLREKVQMLGLATV